MYIVLQQHVGDVVQLYAFPERSKRAAAAAAAAAAQKLAQQEQQPQGEGTGETAQGATMEAGVPGDAEMEDVSGGVGEGEGAAEEEGLPVLLLRELESFRERFPQRVGKHLRADAAEVVLKHQVLVWFDGVCTCLFSQAAKYTRALHLQRAILSSPEYITKQQ